MLLCILCLYVHAPPDHGNIMFSVEFMEVERWNVKFNVQNIMQSADQQNIELLIIYHNKLINVFFFFLFPRIATLRTK